MVLKEHLKRNVYSVVAVFYLLFYTSTLIAQGNCPTVEINFDIPPVICFDPTVSVVDLEVEVVGGNGGGTGQWSGANISNTTLGFFRTAFAQAGEQKVFYTYTEGSCVYRDSATFLFSRMSSPVFLVSYERDGHLCQDSFSVLQVISSYDHSNTNLVWDLAGGVAQEMGSPDLLRVTWDSPGSKLIKLQYEQYGCLSQAIYQQLILDPTIDTPMVACDNTLERVVYDWEDPPNSSATVVFVISGPNGVADTVLDRYTIENLLPGQIVQVRMVTTSENTCDGNFIDPVCESIACDGDLIHIEPIEKVCVSSGVTDTVDIHYSLLDTVTASTLTWAGAGVFDPTQPRIVIDPSMAGQTQWVYVTFESATCTVTDSVSFELIPPPIADFSLPVTTCQEELVTASFTFGPLSPNSDTSLIWDFGDAMVSGDPAGGTVQLSWTTTGTKTVSLAMKVGSCVSAEAVRFINVQAAPEAAVINCTPQANSILFSWQPVPGAIFDVAVLEGPTGVRESTTSYRVSGLSGTETVTIEVTTNGAGLCNTRVVTQSCMAFECPAVSVAIDPIPDICLQPTPVPIDLTATITGGNGGGSLRWSGPNVSGSTWTPDASLSGQTIVIRATYEENTCLYQDSITVNVPAPIIANFALPDEICLTDSVSLEAIGNFSANASFHWLVNGQSDPALTGPGPNQFGWSTPGNREISLSVTEGPCTSQTISRFILVSGALPEPVVNCEPDVDRILFSWDPVPGASDYIVNVLQGPTGQRTSDTSIVFTGLVPGEEVRIEVLLENSGACPDSRTELSCRTPGCPDDLSIVLQNGLAADQFCIGEQDSTIQLSVVAGGGAGTGIISLSGTGTSGQPADNSWTVSPQMAGQTFTISATYTEGSCSVTDQVQMSVQKIPVADFSLPASVCPGDGATITFTGQASPTASFQWQGGNFSGAGPHQLTFNQAGPATFTFGLTVDDNGCLSETVEKSIALLGQYPAPEVSCVSSLDEVVFSWPAQNVSRQEVIYTGPGNGLQTSDTSFVVSGLLPETDVNLEVRFVDDSFPCRNATTIAGCTTASCDLLSLNWSAPASVCAGDPVEIVFSAVGAGSTGFDVVINQGNQTTTHSGITDGSSLSFLLSSSTETFSVIAAGLPGNNSCDVSLPAPLTIMMEGGVNAGNQVVFPSVCAGTDTLINLFGLLANAPLGGQWSFLAGNTAPGSAFSTATGTVRLDNLGAGLYTFQYEVGSGNTCSSSAVQLEITIQQSPVANAGPDISLDCEFNMASLGSNLTSPGMRYSWQGPAGGIVDPSLAITEVSREGVYQLQVTNPVNGCSAEDEVVVAAAPGLVSAFASVIPISCYQANDGTIVIDSISGGIPPFTVFLNGINQGNRTVFNNLAAGNYELQISSSDGCESSLSLNLAAPVELDVELMTNIDRGNNIITAGDSVELTALVNIPADQIAEVNWRSNQGVTSDRSLTHMVNPVITSSYGVQIIDVNGCAAEARLAIVVQKAANVFMPTAFSPNEDGNNDIFYIQADQTVRQILQFRIYNRWGEQLFARQNIQPNDPAEGWDGQNRGLDQPSAVYVYWIEVELSSGEVVKMQGDIALLR